MKIVPRVVHKTWSRLWNFFWLPCSICGDHFGGHEVIGRRVVPSDELWLSEVICPTYERAGHGVSRSRAPG